METEASFLFGAGTSHGDYVAVKIYQDKLIHMLQLTLIKQILQYVQPPRTQRPETTSAAPKTILRWCQKNTALYNTFNYFQLSASKLFSRRLCGLTSITRVAKWEILACICAASIVGLFFILPNTCGIKKPKHLFYYGIKASFFKYIVMHIYLANEIDLPMRLIQV